MRSRIAGVLACFTAAGAVYAQQPAPAPPVHISNHNRDQAQRSFVEGAKQVAANHLAAAATAFGKAASLDPTNPDYEAAFAIAKDNLATQLVQGALKLRMQGDTAGAQTMMLEAAAKDSRNPLVMEHQRELLDANEAGSQDQTPHTVKSDLGPLVELAPNPGVHSFHQLLSKPQLLRQVMAAYGITPTIAASVNNAPVQFDADKVTWKQAEQLLGLATNTFFVPLDPRRALVALDTKENRTQYERLGLETVYLPGLTTAELNDVGNIARNVFGAQQATVHESNNTLTVRAPATQLDAFNKELTELLTGRSEISLDVDMYEVQTENMEDVGAELPQTTNIFNVTSEINNLIRNNPSLVQQIISSGLASPGNIGEIAVALILSGQAGSTLLSQPFAYFGGGLTTTGLTLTSATANLQVNSSDTRMIDKLQLRLLDQEEGTVKIGERYPIVTSRYSNLATGSTSIAGITSAGLSNTLQNLGINLSALSSAASASVPQVQYQDIGLIFSATPRTEQGHDVSLKLKLQLSSLSGATINGSPVFNNRETQSIVSVRPGEKTVLVSQLSNQETSALIGIPGLSEIPGLDLSTNHQINHTRDSLVIVLTPHIVRLSHTRAEGAIVFIPTHS